MKMIRFLSAGVGLFSIFVSASFSSLPQVFEYYMPQYYSPLKNAEYVSTQATIIVRYGPVLSTQVLAGLTFTVQGSKSGLHAGRTILADDDRTVIFKPFDPFTPGEQVRVDIGGLSVNANTSYAPLSYGFTVAIDQRPESPEIGLSGKSLPGDPRSAFPDFLTLPQNIPHYTVSQTSPDSGEGDIFVSPFYWTKGTVGSYLLILNDLGQIVYYQSMADALAGFDFKVLPNGLLSYFNQKDSTFYLMDSHYQVVDTYQAGDGYVADEHDFLLLPDGYALLMAYDAETVDTSKLVLETLNIGQVLPDVPVNSTVTGLVIQELDPSKNVIFEWRSWDHFSFLDSYISLADQNADLVHGNSLALTNDGNLLLSSRDQSEITKIDLHTGNILWRLGGKQNMFQFINGQPFAYQHDVRQLPNGDITVFDNQGTQQDPATSQSLEYQVDEAKKTATQVWSFTHIPPVFAQFMGNTQRLSDGNTFIDWGAPSQLAGYAYDSITEVTPDGSTIFDLTFDEPYASYRAFRFPWQGYPHTLPDLAFKFDPDGITLGYSWNGATQVAVYRVLGGESPRALNLIDEKTKTDFETQSYFSNLPKSECYFQVAAVDKAENLLAYSKVISTNKLLCPITP